MMGMRVLDTLAFVRGGWRLDRVLTDHRSGTRGRFTGHALVAEAPPEQPGEWQYTEQGELIFGAHSGPATRRLRYQARPDGTVAVRFADGRPFYVLDLRSGLGATSVRPGPLPAQPPGARGGPAGRALAGARTGQGLPCHYPTNAQTIARCAKPSHHGRQQRDISHARAPARGW
jgi:Family of unknown function (DUF6314)